MQNGFSCCKKIRKRSCSDNNKDRCVSLLFLCPQLCFHQYPKRGIYEEKQESPSSILPDVHFPFEIHYYYKEQKSWQFLNATGLIQKRNFFFKLRSVLQLPQLQFQSTKPSKLPDSTVVLLCVFFCFFHF